MCCHAAGAFISESGPRCLNEGVYAFQDVGHWRTVTQPVALQKVTVGVLSIPRAC